jgi:hypothetical protein
MRPARRKTAARFDPRHRYGLAAPALPDERFDITATMPPANTQEQLRVMLVLRFIKTYPIKLDAEVQYCLLVRQAGRASEVGCQPTQKVSWAADERG